MRSDGWRLTEDLDGFLARAGDFLTPARHTLPLTVSEPLRTRRAGALAPVFGHLRRSGEVHAALYRRPPGPLSVTPLTPGQADALAAYLAGLGHVLPGVNAEHDTAMAFAQAWRQYTGATPTLRARRRLHRLGTLTPPKPFPAGRGRVAGARDREHIMLWCGEFAASVGEDFPSDAASWDTTRFAAKRFTFWETPDGTPVSMAGVTPMVSGQVRVDPVYTPAHRRGRGYAGAVTVAVSRAALDSGAAEVVLSTDPANPTSNALYQRIGYLPVTELTEYEFSYDATGAGQAPDWLRW